MTRYFNGQSDAEIAQEAKEAHLTTELLYDVYDNEGRLVVPAGTVIPTDAYEGYIEHDGKIIVVGDDNLNAHTLRDRKTGREI